MENKLIEIVLCVDTNWSLESIKTDIEEELQNCVLDYEFCLIRCFDVNKYFNEIRKRIFENTSELDNKYPNPIKPIKKLDKGVNKMYITVEHYNGFDIIKTPNTEGRFYIKIQDGVLFPTRSIAEAKRRIDFHNKYPEMGNKSFLDIIE